MGLLGSNFVRAMLARGEEVKVWNRTASKAAALEQYGAKAFEELSEAVKGADVIHVTLKDDASVDNILMQAEASLKPGAVIIDHTTTSKEGAIKRTGEWMKKGFYYQHAPVFMGPSNALDGTGFMLVSGNRELLNRLQPELVKMTGKLLDFGEEAGKAAAIKLVGNAFLVCFTAGIKDTLALGRALEVSLPEMLSLFVSWNPASQTAARLQKIAVGDYSNPSWELNMARKDTGLFIQAAQQQGTELTLLPVIAALMDKWIHKGFGNNDWTVIAKEG